jgi:hypothetical protein
MLWSNAALMSREAGEREVKLASISRRAHARLGNALALVL